MYSFEQTKSIKCALYLFLVLCVILNSSKVDFSKNYFFRNRYYNEKEDIVFSIGLTARGAGQSELMLCSKMFPPVLAE